ncbi:MAG: tRNA threonylcarbamoyladenosine dehydratase [Magnetococcales bacterium]|nr:tRNA threonylcarbamoyladenosine dehydratase [Magnetococcales bacterium]NGZ07407.1 tRNA threonylcarbamoyladenosine dehydratase [Magnetococcales bacterium]
MAEPGLFTRTEILVQAAGVERLRAAHVLLVGLGGVGGFAAEALGRAGIGRLTLLDHDVVAPTDLNRQLPSTQETMGEKKVTVLGQRIGSINPECRLVLLDCFLTPKNTPEILEQAQPDWVIDAIDSLNSKVNLLLAARARGLAVVSSMGAGGRLDPTRLVVGDVMDSTICPLAREVRRRLHRRGQGRGIWAVWSTEPPAPPLPPEPTPTGRPRSVNGTISYLPALFGMTLAGIVIRSIVTSTS